MNLRLVESRVLVNILISRIENEYSTAAFNVNIISELRALAP
jgi:hypothetical protein